MEGIRIKENLNSLKTKRERKWEVVRPTRGLLFSVVSVCVKSFVIPERICESESLSRGLRVNCA